MELRPGYKQTEVGIIPKDWKIVSFQSIGIIEGGYAFSSKKFLNNGRYQVVKMSNLYGGFLNLERSTSFLNELGEQEKNYILCKDNILITLTGTTGKQDYGFSYRIGHERDLLVNQRVAKITIGENADAGYIAFQVKSPAFLDQFFNVSKGGTGNQTNVGTSDVAAMFLPCPDLPEQRAIAAALSDVDALIQELDQLITKKRDIKQAAMQQLLTGQTRLPGFSDEWVTKRMGDVFTFSGGYSASRDQLSTEGQCYLHYGDIHGSSKGTIDTKADYQEIPKLNIPLKRVSSKSFLADGDVVFVDASEDDAGTSKHVVVVNKGGVPFIAGLHTIVGKAKTAELAHEYLCYCFQTAAIRQQFMFYAVGTKVSGISKTNIVKLVLPICLVSCDHIPRRSWPLFRAKAVIKGLIAGIPSRQSRSNLKALEQSNA